MNLVVGRLTVPNIESRCNQLKLGHPPDEKYTEVFIDEGVNDMYAVMKELVRQKYSRLIYPEHPRALDYDRERPDFSPYYPGGGGYAAYAYNVGYTRAMLQASLAS